MVYNNIIYKQLLLSELRFVPYKPGDNYSQANMLKSVTVNEELMKLGFRLSVEDIVNLSASESLDGMLDCIRNSMGDVKAEPMYPGFPEQVIAMDEALLRFHQLLHYASTYSLEMISGNPVTKGWLPETNSKRCESDERILDSKVIALVDEAKMYFMPFRTILSKKERMTDKELLIIRECVRNLTVSEIIQISVPFKQNLMWLFYTLFADKQLTSEDKIVALHGLCQHTGDVWKCFDFTLTRENYHLRTSQKRLMVKLFESYPVSDFTENLILSNKKRERTLLLLKYIDYNIYSRSPSHKQAVADLRSDKLRSWESRAKYLVEQHNENALEYISNRPGMLLRWAAYLFRSGYLPSDIEEHLCRNAESLRIQSVVSALNHFSAQSAEIEEDERYEAMFMAETFRHVLRKCFSKFDTPLKDKKVFLDFKEYDLEHSTLMISDKSVEGGYIRSGLSYKIPNDVKKIRFFVYWNDQKRVDIDLHGVAEFVRDEPIYIGWNADYKKGVLVFSGDITHSDAAEYIDIDLEMAVKDLSYVKTSIDLYSGYSTFREVSECYVGCMAIKNTGENIKLYDPANCFFTHYLTGDYRTIGYGFINIVHRCITFVGNQTNNWYDTAHPNSTFSLANYLDMLLSEQHTQVVNSPDMADYILVMGKPASEKEISMIDSNFFMDK